jgi:hypothetical protein
MQQGDDLEPLRRSNLFLKESRADVFVRAGTAESTSENDR